MGIPVTVLISTTTSAAFRLGGRRVGAIRMPAALTSVAMTFSASDTEAGTYLPVYSDAAAVSLVVAPSRHIALGADESNALASCDWVKIVCGSTEIAERLFDVILELDPA